MNDFKSIIEEAADAANHAPADLKEATYTVILQFLLHSQFKFSDKVRDETESDSHSDGGDFLTKLGIQQNEWQCVFDEDDSGVHIVVREIPGRTAIERQTNLALLLALKLWKGNGAVTTFEGKELSVLCKDYDCWSTNIAGNIMKSGYFRKDRPGYKLIKRGEDAAIALVRQIGGTETNG